MKTLLTVLISFYLQMLFSQYPKNNIIRGKEFYTIKEALKNPKEVYRLTLDSTAVGLPLSTWAKFTNIEYLSLKNDHLKKIPDGIGLLKSLKTLDLSGNDFETLPSTFSELINLNTLFLNDERNFKLDLNITILDKLPNLRSLYLENDNLENLPTNFFNLKKLENLYLNDNHFKRIPAEIKNLKNLKFLDFHHNDLKPMLNPNSVKIPDPNFGLKIKF